MRIVYKRSLTFIGLLIVLIAVIGIGYLFYDQVIHPETLVVVSDELSINYLDGNAIISDGEYRFSVTNNGSNDVYYQIRLIDISGYDPDVTYSLSSSDTSVSGGVKALSDSDNIVMDNILINSLDTQTFTLEVSNNTSTNFKIEVKRIDDIEEYFYMTVLNNNEIKEASVSEVGVEVATTSEGLIASVDDDGASYYFRGSVDNNYVLFAGLTWRIVRINGDGTVRLVLDGVSDTLSNYNTENEGYEDFSETDIYTALNNYYDSYLRDYEASIANTRFCSEYGKTDDTYNAYTRIVTNEIPTLNCLGDRYTSRIGLLTADEVVYAGGLYGEENTDYYLYHEEIENLWWTMSLAKTSDDTFYPFLVNESGELVDHVSGSLYRSFRPVISLSRTVMVTGTGTLDDPYVVS